MGYRTVAALAISTLGCAPRLEPVITPPTLAPCETRAELEAMMTPPADAPNPLRARFMAASAAARLDAWSAAADRWGEVAALDARPHYHAAWHTQRLSALMEAGRWSEVCAGYQALLAVQGAEAATWPLFKALEAARPEAVPAARCMVEAARGPLANNGDRFFRHLGALLTCAEGDRSGAIAALEPIATGTLAASAPARADLERLRGGGACAEKGSRFPGRAGLTKEEIRHVVRGALPRITACYEPRLVDHPDSHGYVAVNFSIDTQGRVERALIVASTLADTATELCTAEIAQTLQFPASSNPADVTYPFVFCAQR